ncbi:BMP family ABC transporter substrate-binding protein [Anaerosacchariphilus polymeriproducens]|uniref:BMP family ABC transporter substrate-binding protein n=1 Tax=Anaerosacchariphilus polymeriproducens TaxID=1812858 RepID=A0A371AT07_9FIRM|nr:BMP family ABC transporter substrate-binding protein [Anaerosacchariphilus polymeriproducens]RDU22590.1 BMP family ABC transporter substrate-binding protein [Anaerosacchariphilus polymeriproducens]
MKMKRVVAFGLALTMGISLIGCGGKKKAEETSDKNGKDFSVAMITDTAGVNDQSFNQSAWEGLQEFGEDTGAKVNYLESKQSSDYVTNLERLGDNNSDFIWAIGFDTADALLEVAKENQEFKYAIIDNAYEETPSNVTGVIFKAQEPSFLVGYVAGKTTKTNKVGFVGGIENAVIQQFMFGYQAGVAFAGKEMGKEIKIDVQYAESFADAAKGKAIASKMYSEGCDIVYQAAGGSGTGVIEAAKEAGKFAIGVDRDQAYLAPKNVLTSALKKVGTAIQNVSEKVMNGEEVGGKTLVFGLTEDCVGIPEKNPNMDSKVYEDTMKIKDMIKSGVITPPGTETDYAQFLKSIK